MPSNPDPIPMPRTTAELMQWAERLNNQYARIHDIEAEHARARKALDDAFAVVRAPHEAMADLTRAGITAYVRDHERAIKRHHGRTFTHGPFTIKYAVQAKSVVTKSDAELASQLLEAGYEDLVRYKPEPNKTAIKSARRTRKLRRILDDAGAYVSRHQTVTLTLPALEKPLELLRTRYPFVRRNEPPEEE